MGMGGPITVLLFSQYSLPVSTSLCITDATVGIVLCDRTIKAVDFQWVGLSLLTWVMIMPIAGKFGVVLMGVFLNALHFSS
jgi:sodium-dependent phosphate transporter